MGKSLVKRKSASEQIADILSERISSGEWESGMKIPSENEIAIEFEVSRMTARNAVQRLVALGVLEAKSGDGTFVKAFDLNEYFANATKLIVGEHSLNDVREFRYYFESQYLVLACQRRTEEDIMEIEALHQEMMRAASIKNPDLFFEKDFKFHTRICQAAHNEVFNMVNLFLQQLLAGQLKDNTKLYAKIKGASLDPDADNYVLKQVAEEHMDFIESLKKRDPSIAGHVLGGYMEIYNQISEE